jgi:hypothetical protein
MANLPCNVISWQKQILHHCGSFHDEENLINSIPALADPDDGSTSTIVNRLTLTQAPPVTILKKAFECSTQLETLDCRIMN